jgi:ABC-type transporter Mla subunit MlaD
VQTTPAGDIDRMAAAFARAAEKLDPDDVKAIVHGLALALNDKNSPASALPGEISQVAADLHTLAVSLQTVSGQSSDVLKQVKPVLAHLDEQIAKVGVTLDDLQPSLKKLPGTMDHLERASARIDDLLAKADKLDKEELKRDLRQILEEEGVYVRMRPRKVGKDGKPAPDEDEKAPAPSPLPGLQR